MISHVKLSKFKQIKKAALPLGRINVLVGGNNSGKSCILQGTHFGIALAQARQIAGINQLPSNGCGTVRRRDFLGLHHGRRLQESTSIDFRYETGDQSEDDSDFAFVKLQRGRNGCGRAAGGLMQEISDPRGFFSIYVPGLAGITIREARKRKQRIFTLAA